MTPSRPRRGVPDRFQAVLNESVRRDHRDRPCGRVLHAEDYHQQYPAKVPNGYWWLGGTGVSCPIGVASADWIPATTLVRHLNLAPTASPGCRNGQGVVSWGRPTG
jgi:hypothetical protein